MIASASTSGTSAHRDVPGAADVAQLGARDEPLEAAPLARQQDHVELSPEQQHRRVQRRQAARLGVEGVLERGVEARAARRTAPSPRSARPDPCATAAPWRARRAASGSRGCAAGLRAQARSPQPSASRAGFRRPTAFSRACWSPAGEMAVTVRARPRRASSSEIQPPSELPARWALSKPAPSISRSTASASASGVESTPAGQRLPSGRGPGGPPPARRSAARAAGASASSHARCGRSRG